MGVEIVTKADLDEFRLRLLQDLENVIATSKPKMWLKTQEVMDMLGMSEVTLQTLRNKGIIPFRKLGGICYYNAVELDEVMKNLLPHHPFESGGAEQQLSAKTRTYGNRSNNLSLRTGKKNRA